MAGHCGCDDMFPSHMTPVHNPNWIFMNRFYRFENMAQDIVLHRQEITDPTNRRRFIPCGEIQVRRSFTVNPGAQLIFRFNIWKNDMTSVHNTQSIARALRLDLSMSPPRPHAPVWRPRPSWRPPFMDGSTLVSLVNLLADKKATSRLHAKEIAELRRLVEELKESQGGGQGPPDYPPDYPPDCECGYCEECCDDYDDGPGDEYPCECGVCEECDDGYDDGPGDGGDTCECGTCPGCCSPNNNNDNLRFISTERVNEILLKAGWPQLNNQN